jgi:competence protein ComEA
LKIKKVTSFFNLLRYFSIGQQRILLVLALFLLGVLYFKFYYSPPTPSGEITKEIVVEISGEVRNPGIYIFKTPPTIKEAIERAGGLNEPARFDNGSFSEPLETGALLHVLKVSHQQIKMKIGRMEANRLLVFSIPLDLNRVSMEDLCLIPGIGESLAREIVAYRERRKGFESVEALKNIKGIGEKKYESVKRFFAVRTPP